MRIEGVTRYVSGRDPVPLPTTAQHITPPSTASRYLDVDQERTTGEVPHE